MGRVACHDGFAMRKNFERETGDGKKEGGKESAWVERIAVDLVACGKWDKIKESVKGRMLRSVYRGIREATSEVVR